MNIVLLNQFFPPAQAPTSRFLGAAAEELIRRGHQVTVVTSATDYGAASHAQANLPPDIQVIRVGPTGGHQQGVGAKLWGYLSFFRRAEYELAHLPDPPDALVCMTTPPFCGQMGVRLQKKQGVPFVLWCMDLYPEALAAHGMLSQKNPLFLALKKLARRERSRASRVIALGPDMASLLKASGASRVVEIPAWSEFSVTPALQAEARDLRRERGWAEDEVILLYGGNMGRAHRVEEFLDLARQLQGRTPRCRLVFSGDGPQRDIWAQQGKGLFEFMPLISHASCTAHLLAADIHLVSQQPEWTGVVVPSKFQAACAVGRPVVFAGPPQSAVGAWLSESGAGWTIPPGDAAAVEQTARNLLDAGTRTEKAQQASLLFEQRFTRAAQCAKLIEQIEEVVKERA